MDSIKMKGEKLCKDSGLELIEVPYVNRGRDLHLKIMIPGGTGPFPTVLFVQGSGWRKQNTDASVINLHSFAASGYVVAVVEYRFTDEGGYFPAQVEDAKTAVRFMRKNAEKFKADPDNMFLWGDSSGGHTALLAGMTARSGELDTDDYSEISCEVNAIADYYGVVDPADPQGFPQAAGGCGSPQSNEGLLFGGRRISEVMEYAAGSVVLNYVDREYPPIFIQHGDVDDVVVCRHSVRLHEALEEHGKEHEFHVLEGANHGDRMFYTWDNMKMVDAFFRRYMV